MQPPQAPASDARPQGLRLPPRHAAPASRGPSPPPTHSPRPSARSRFPPSHPRGGSPPPPRDSQKAATCPRQGWGVPCRRLGGQLIPLLGRLHSACHSPHIPAGRSLLQPPAIAAPPHQSCKPPFTPRESLLSCGHPAPQMLASSPLPSWIAVLIQEKTSFPGARCRVAPLFPPSHIFLTSLPSSSPLLTLRAPPVIFSLTCLKSVSGAAPSPHYTLTRPVSPLALHPRPPLLTPRDTHALANASSAERPQPSQQLLCSPGPQARQMSGALGSPTRWPLRRGKAGKDRGIPR